MTLVLAVWIARVLAAVALAKISGERAERHAVHLRFARPVGAFDVEREFAPGFRVDEGEIRVKNLLRAQFDFKSARPSEFHKHWAKEEFQHLGDNFCVTEMV
jgi:hypothetical protein